jgi:hypothetical protein
MNADKEENKRRSSNDKRSGSRVGEICKRTAVLIGSNEKDSVFFSVSGRFETSKDKCVGTSAGTYIVTGGTEAFANATGSGTYEAQRDVCAATGTHMYTGTFSKPNSN